VRFDGEALKRIREQRGLSQRQLAKAAGVHSTAVSRLENGARSNPQASTITHIARALGVSVEELIHE
jgi:transcriptional regulator with XRE-family HTH domain